MALRDDHHPEPADRGRDGSQLVKAESPHIGTVQWTKKQQGWTHVLVDQNNMEDLQQPVRATSRVKYVCVTASDNLIAMGTNTGVVYVFNRSTLRYIHMLPGDKEGSVVNLSLSPDGQLLGYAISTGLILVVKLPGDQRAKPDRLRAGGDHRGSAVSAMCWNQQSNRLFVGDNLGKVSVLSFFQASSKARGLLRPMSETIMKLDSAVVQIDAFNEKIVVSTRTRTYLCNTTTQQFSQIGKRPRDGQYGSCFYPSTDSEAAIIYCSRPGSRVWEVDYGGEVLNTHQFKQLLDVAPLPLVETRNTNFSYPLSLGEGPGPQSVLFSKLILIGGQFLLSWTEDTIYILDPVNIHVLLWNKQLRGIADVCCRGDHMYVLKDDGCVVQLQLFKITKLVGRTFSQRRWTLCAELAVCYGETVTSVSGSAAVQDVTQTMMAELKKKLPDDSILTSRLDALITELMDREVVDDLDEATVPSPPDRGQSPTYDLMDNGIYVIKNRFSPLRPRRMSNQIGNNHELSNGYAGKRTDSSGNVIFKRGEVTDLHKIRSKDADNVAMVTKSHVSVTNDAEHRVTSDERDGMLPRNRVTESLDANIEKIKSTSSKEDIVGFQHAGTVNISEVNTMPPEVTPEHSEQPVRWPRRLKLLAVRERISTRVRTTTKSVIENLKDKKSKLARKVIHSSGREGRLVRVFGRNKASACVPSHGHLKVDSEDEAIACTSKFPTIQTYRLEIATREACGQMENVRVFYDPPTAIKVLNQWLKVLHQTLHCLHLAILEEQIQRSPSSVTQDKADPQDMSRVTQGEADPQDMRRVTQGEADPQDMSHVTQGEADPQDMNCVTQGEADPQDMNCVTQGEADPQDMRRVTQGEADPQDMSRVTQGEADPQDMSHITQGEADPQDMSRVTQGEADPQDMSRVTQGEADPQDMSHVTQGEADPQDMNCVTQGEADPQDMNCVTQGEADPQDMRRVTQGEADPQDMSLVTQGEADPQDMSRVTQGEADPQDMSRVTQGEADPQDMSHVTQGEADPQDMSRVTQGEADPQDMSRVTQGEADPQDMSRVTQGEADPQDMSHVTQDEADLQDMSRVTQGEADPQDMSHVTQGKADPQDMSRVTQGEADPQDMSHVTQGEADPQDMSRVTQGEADPQDMSHVTQAEADPQDMSGVTQGEADPQDMSRVTQDKADPPDMSPNSITQNKADHKDMSRVTQGEADPQDMSRVTQGEADPQDMSRVTQDKADPQDMSHVTQGDADPQDMSRVTQGEADPQDMIPNSVSQDNVDPHDMSLSSATQDKAVQDIGTSCMKPHTANRQGNESLPTNVTELHGTTYYQDRSIKDTRVHIDSEDNISTENEDGNSSIGNANLPEIVVTSVDTLRYEQSIQRENVDFPVNSCPSIDCDNGTGTPDQGQVVGHSIFRDVVYLTDPFSLTAEVHSQVSALAQLCWSFRCHGAVSAYLVPCVDTEQDQGSELFAGSIDSDTASKNDLSRCHVIGGTEVLRPQWYDSRQFDLDNGESEEDDLELAVFLRCYFHLFSGAVDKVHETIRISQGSRFHRWRCLVDCLMELGEDNRVTRLIMQQETQAAIDILRSEISPKNCTLILAHMIRLYGMVPLKTLEFCAEISKFVSALDVLYMTAMGSKVNSHFLFYIKRLLAQNDRTFRAMTLGGVCSDPEIRHVLLQCLFNHHPPDWDNLSCTCGMPRPGAHCIQWQEGSLIDQLLDLPTARATEKDMTRSHGYWPGYLKMCLRQGDKDAHQMAAVQLGDLRLLTRDNPLGSVPDSIEEWRKLLQWKKQQRSLQNESDASSNETLTQGGGLYQMFCLWCGAALTPAKLCPNPRGPKSQSVKVSPRREDKSRSKPSSTGWGQLLDWRPDMTWENLGQMLVETVGAERGLQLLRQVAPPDDTMSARFDHRCVASTIIDSKMVDGMMSNIDSQLSTTGAESEQQPSIPHDDMNWTELSNSPNVTELDQTISPEGADLQTSGRQGSVGVSTKGICSCCGLLYGTSVLPLGPGIALFKCGHGFHRSCAPCKHCPVCEPSETSEDSGSLFKQ